MYILSSIGTDFRKKINLIPSNKALIYYTRCCVFVFILFKDSIQKAKDNIDSVKDFINLIENNSDLFKSVGISVTFKGKTIF